MHLYRVIPSQQHYANSKEKVRSITVKKGESCKPRVNEGALGRVSSRFRCSLLHVNRYLAASRSIAHMLRTRSLSIAFALALVPLVILLALQYNWLSQLQANALVVRNAALRSHLDSLGDTVDNFYHTTAERLLNVPATFFSGNSLENVAGYWRNKKTDGVRLLFVVDYTKVPTGNYYIFDPAQGELNPTPASDESVAIVLATLPWQAGGAQLSRGSGLQTNEQDPNRRLIMNPLLGPKGEVIAIVGMMMDREYFVLKLLTPLLRKLEKRGALLKVLDEQGTKVLGSGPKGMGRARMRFGFVFSNWTVIVYASGEDSDSLESAFVWNMGVGVLLAVVLLSGIAFALGAAGKAMRLSRMKTDFVSNVSHELRTPLASIRVFAELLSHGKVVAPEKIRQYGSYIDGESRRLSHLIDNILDFSHIESQRKTYALKATDIVELVQHTVQAYNLGFGTTQERVKLELPTDITPIPMLAVDAPAIALALHNLLDNAIKYGEDSEVKVTLQWNMQAQELTISVKDEGIGIEPHEQVRVFERFHRVGSSLVHDVKGSGLGLAIVAHVMRAHGGQVTVESVLGKGSTFVLHLSPQNISTILD